VPLSAASAIPPLLRAHYALETPAEAAAEAAAGPADAAAASPEAGPFLAFRPCVSRVWTGAGPLARLALCGWKGKSKYNLMLDTTEAAGLVQALCSAGYKAE
jgi:hypothetical protein